jgi:hypothetical protein
MTTTPADPRTIRLDPPRLTRAKRGFTTRHLDLSSAQGLLTDAAPRAGDVLLARVDEVGQHQRIEQPDGRRAALFPGDEVLVAYGHRYAPDQFEAVVPGDLGRCSLVAAGGLAGAVEAAHGKMSGATTLDPVGLLLDARGHRANLLDGALSSGGRPVLGSRPVTIAVAGASMNAGKTTTAAHLVRGLHAAGLRVGAAKVTGTGAGGDVWLLQDAGARPVYDFTTAGLPSTYRMGHQQVVRVFTELTDQLAHDGCDVVVLEVADGVYQAETAALLQDPVFRDRVDALLFAALDALGACAGDAWLEDRGLAPLALSGVLSASPLATREAEAATGRQVWGLERLGDAATAEALYEGLLAGRLGTAGEPAVDAAAPVEDPDPAVEVALARPRLRAV